MSFDLVPAELLASALTAVTLSIPLSFILAAAAIAGPRHTWNWAGLGMGMGLLLGVCLAAAGAIAGIGSAFLSIAGIALLLGLLCAILAGVLVILLEDGATFSAVVGILACTLIGLGTPGEALPAYFGLSSSLLVVVAGVVIEAVALVAIVGFLVAAAGRVRALQIGVAVAGIVAAVILILGSLTEVPMLGILITVLVALVVGSISGGVRETLRVRRQSTSAAERS